MQKNMQNPFPNKVQRLLTSQRIQLDLSFDQLINFYEPKESENKILMDDIDLLITTQVGPVSVWHDTRAPDFLPPTEYIIEAKGNEDDILAELLELFGEPCEIEKWGTDSISRFWKDGFSLVKMQYYFTEKNYGRNPCTITFNTGFRLPISPIEERALSQMKTLNKPYLVKYSVFKDENLGLLRQGTYPIGLGFDYSTQLVCLSDGLQCAVLEAQQIIKFRLVLWSCRGSRTSTLIADYKDPFSPNIPYRSLEIFFCEGHFDLDQISINVLKEVGKKTLEIEWHDET